MAHGNTGKERHPLTRLRISRGVKAYWDAETPTTIARKKRLSEFASRRMQEQWALQRMAEGKDTAEDQQLLEAGYQAAVNQAMDDSHES